MDALTANLSQLQVNDSAYFRALEEIIRFVNSNRRSPITDAECAVTLRLAQPYEPGGILIVLQQPGHWHQWHQGVDKVIEECPSLDILNEVIQIASMGSHSLTNGVSLIDARPFFDEQAYDKLKELPGKEDELWELVLKAIRAKMPDVVLLMGHVCRFCGFDRC
jgi:hypothetical protein